MDAGNRLSWRGSGGFGRCPKRKRSALWADHSAENDTCAFESWQRPSVGDRRYVGKLRHLRRSTRLKAAANIESRSSNSFVTRVWRRSR